jgi:hypothetical protein
MIHAGHARGSGSEPDLAARLFAAGVRVTYREDGKVKKRTLAN